MKCARTGDIINDQLAVVLLPLRASAEIFIIRCQQMNETKELCGDARCGPRFVSEPEFLNLTYPYMAIGLMHFMAASVATVIFSHFYCSRL